jgi:outer membrane receptor for ferrienterochelin and colicin
MAMKRQLLLLFALMFALNCVSQNIFSCIVKDEETGEPLSNVSIVGKGDLVHTVTDNNGKAKFLIKPGKYIINFSCIGYELLEMELTVPLKAQDSALTILMKKDEKELEQVIISSSRTDSRIENTPTRVEVIGTEEVEEEGGVKPSHIANLLGDVAGIQQQQTSAVTGNTDLRIQGLPGDYTQILRDGMPLFGGYAGSFSILQIPPLDIRQIEIIKGASSTLYGGGAIAGMINIISKKPRVNEKERYLLLNQTTLQESNLNIYLSEGTKKTGYTFFAGANYQKQKDVNNDGFSDLARVEGVFVHPTFFFYPNEKNTLSIGVNSTYEDRKGGDMDILSGYFSNFHQFFIQNQTYRNTFDVVWDNKISKTDKLTVKGTTSSFNRSIGSNIFGMKAKQLSFFTEISYVKKMTKHDLVGGINLNGERLKKAAPDSTRIADYRYSTLGFFIQDDWRIYPKLTVESGIRSDFHNKHGIFILPRISVLYKINQYLAMRMGGGLGYKIPTVFENEIDERDYPKIAPLENVKAEKSAGVNWDINFKKRFGEVTVSINQSFYITQINSPVISFKPPGVISFFNASKPISTKGFETWVQISVSGLEAYIGYTLADARKKYDAAQPYVELSARNKFASVISCEFSKHFRACIEAAYTGQQYLADGSRSPSFPIIAGMIQLNTGRFSFVINCENLNDYRQTKKEAILIPPVINPRFKQLWAPIDGRVANLSMRIKL